MVSAVVACTSAPSAPVATVAPPTPLPTPVLAPTAGSTAQPQALSFDQQFIDMMVPHHEGAVEMAHVAESRAQRIEIKSMAADILQSQGAEIDQMRAWRQMWFGSAQTPPIDHMPLVGPMGDMPMSMSMNSDGTVDMSKDVADLRAAQEPFDAAFIEAMIPHHQMAISAARLALTRAEHVEISQLADAILTAQQREVGQMQAWRLQWYGSMRADMNAPTPAPASRAQPTQMPGMPGMMDEGH